jgi:ferritin-like protein
MASDAFHEDPRELKPATRDRHRAIASLMEELEAVDWYDQRIDAAGDDELRRILAHNRDEEKEHAAMVLEWLRRHDPQLDAHLKGYLFSEGNLLEREERLESEAATPAASDGSLGIGSMKAGAK